MVRFARTSMNSKAFTGFVDLGRTFQDLQIDPEGGDDSELRPSLLGREAIRWPELLAEHRLVLLAEAGAGKTEEIRAAAHRLREDGRSAFFLRIEHIADHLEDAFEVGDVDEFNAWLGSAEEAWLLLDSVDEARLSSPRDFELAMRVLSRRIKIALQRTRIVITGRTTAWRPRSDLQLCRSLFPYERPKLPETVDENSSAKPKDNLGSATEPFRIVALNDLSPKQIERFLTAKGVDNVPAFLAAVEHADAWLFTSRPQDLEELAGFWIKERRIGSRLEIMRASIDRRLTERDQDHAEASPLALDRAREGARLVAAASTLAKQALISVPDVTEHAGALSIRTILSGWTEPDCATLASRPIFEPAIYGTVRFHHRSVREYLTAEWLQSLLHRQGSRRRIEQLFFSEQYGIPVVIPSMRPILPWLAILDEGIQARIVSLAPEITFEGGDPTQLSPETRRTVLRQVCEQLAQPAHGQVALDYMALQRFAGGDIATDIRALLTDYAADKDIVWFLLRLVFHGELKEAAPDAKRFAIQEREHYARAAALKAVRIVGSARDSEEVRDVILKEPEPLLRDWLDELVQGLPPDSKGVDWLVTALEKVEPKERLTSDSLSDSLSSYIDQLPADLLPGLAQGIGELLNRTPLMERPDSGISHRYQWLAQFAARTLARLIEARHPQALAPETLSMLRRIRSVRDYHDLDMKEAPANLPSLVQSWPDLNDALFWRCVVETREERKKSDGPLVEYWHVSIMGSDWGFDGGDFQRLLGYVATRPLVDDRRIALSLAFAVYVRSNRPRKWRELMKKTALGQPELEDDLSKFLHPPADANSGWRREQRKWKQQHKRREARNLKENERNRDWLRTHLAHVRGPPSDGPGVTSAQHYLLNKMSPFSNNSGYWTEGNWESLIPEFGDEVAKAFRDAAVGFWRQSRPLLLSEGGTTGSTPIGSVLGLAGLAIESRETPNWAATLSDPEAELAVRYALEELNGFPPWLPDVYAHHPDVVIDIVMREIAFELAKDAGESNYVLHDASWSGQWMWDRLAPALIPELAANRCSAGNLRYVLNILQGSSIPDDELATVARGACAASIDDPVHTAMWFAAWVGVDPVPALNTFDTYLASLPDDAARTNIAMVFCTHLLGSRRRGTASRQAFRTVHHLKRIFILLHTHVRQSDDIERAGKGVYSPELRDEAQDARNSIFAIIKDLPGKESFLALMELSVLHPDDAARPWMAYHAKAKAEQDSDMAAWTVTQFVDFNAELERTPSNHRELWELALSRLYDLKVDLERGDTSIASILLRVDAEEELRNFVGGWCRDRAANRYLIPQEEELADERRPDLRFQGAGFDAPVPVELKIADNWTGPHLFERLETQLCGDYLRDPRSNRGIFLLIYRGTRAYWELPDGSKAENLGALVEALQRRWSIISDRYPDVEGVRVIGIDLQERGRRIAEVAK